MHAALDVISSRFPHRESFQTQSCISMVLFTCIFLLIGSPFQLKHTYFEKKFLFIYSHTLNVKILSTCPEENRTQKNKYQETKSIWIQARLSHSPSWNQEGWKELEWSDLLAQGGSHGFRSRTAIVHHQLTLEVHPPASTAPSFQNPHMCKSCVGAQENGPSTRILMMP